MRRARAGALAGLGWASAVGFVGSLACEPQDIYMYERSARAPEDAGASTPERPAPERPAPEQPAPEAPAAPPCLTEECQDCVDRQACAAAASLLFCHPESGACVVPCDAAARDTPGNCPDGLRCHPEHAVCVGCLTNLDCDANAPECDASSNACFECLGPESPCPAEEPVCDTAARRCVECVADSDCERFGRVCQQSTQRCVQCQTDADCRALARRNDDDDLRRCSAELTCVECLVDADCAAIEPDKPFCTSELECDDERK